MDESEREFLEQEKLRVEIAKLTAEKNLLPSWRILQAPYIAAFASLVQVFVLIGGVLTGYYTGFFDTKRERAEIATQKANQAAEQARSELASLDARKSQLSIENSNLRSDAAVKRAALTQAQAAIQDLQRKNASSSASGKALEEKFSATQTQLTKALSDLDASSTRLIIDVMEPASALSFRSPNPIVRFSYTVRNTGPLTTIGVGIFPKLIPIFWPSAVADNNARHEAMTCENAKSNHSGFELASNKTRSGQFELTSDLVAKPQNFAQFSERPVLQFAVVGCFDYAFAYSPQVHRQLPFYYVLEAPAQKSADAQWVLEIPREMLRLTSQAIHLN